MGVDAEPVRTAARGVRLLLAHFASRVFGVFLVVCRALPAGLRVQGGSACTAPRRRRIPLRGPACARAGPAPVMSAPCRW
ncbi:hypothetical protein GCM10027440_00530 [Nocardiopsis coralliicola]